jgi:hypothetical protein
MPANFIADVNWIDPQWIEGYGRWVYPTLVARAAGYRCAILDAEAGAISVYHRLGFEEFS